MPSINVQFLGLPSEIIEFAKECAINFKFNLVVAQLFPEFKAIFITDIDSDKNFNKLYCINQIYFLKSKPDMSTNDYMEFLGKNPDKLVFSLGIYTNEKRLFRRICGWVEKNSLYYYPPFEITRWHFEPGTRSPPLPRRPARPQMAKTPAPSSTTPSSPKVMSSGRQKTRCGAELKQRQKKTNTMGTIEKSFGTTAIFIFRIIFPFPTSGNCSKMMNMKPRAKARFAGNCICPLLQHRGFCIPPLPNMPPR